MKWNQASLEGIENLRQQGRMHDMTPRPAIEPTPDLETEKRFQAAVEREAKKRGWRFYHTRDSRKSVAGFPDLVMVRSGRLLIAELKVGDNKPDADQQNWLEDFGQVQANIGRPFIVQVFVWYPADWSTILAVLDNPDAMGAAPTRDWSTVCAGMGGPATGPKCCERAGEYNGFASSPTIFTCPKHCGCHD